MKINIGIGSPVPLLEGSGKPGFKGGWPIPPTPYQVKEEAELIVRLASTRAGNSAWWQAGDGARLAMNGARYEPLLRAVVQGFEWSPAATRDNPMILPRVRMGQTYCPSYPHPDLAIQGGTAVLNWTALVVRPLADPVGDLVRETWRRVTNAVPVEDAACGQGHLTVWGRCRPLEELLELRFEDLPVENREEGISGQYAWIDQYFQEIPSAGSGPRALYNHLVYPARLWAWRVVNGTAVAVVGIGRDGAWVLSADHPDEPVRLVGDAWYVLSHPLPSADSSGAD